MLCLLALIITQKENNITILEETLEYVPNQLSILLVVFINPYFTLHLLIKSPFLKQFLLLIYKKLLSISFSGRKLMLNCYNLIHSVKLKFSIPSNLKKNILITTFL